MERLFDYESSVAGGVPAMTSATTTKVTSSNVTPVKMRPHSAKPVTADEKASRQAYVEKEMASDKLAQLRAEKQRIADEIKAAKDAAKGDRLADEIARQREHPNKALVYTLGAALRNRIAAGQERATAIDEILEQCRALLESAPERQPKASKKAAD
jgi:hypothetical protein